MPRLKPYPRVKDSGVEWIGHVPSHWEVVPNRSIFEEIKERDRPEDPLLSVTIRNGVVRQKDLLEDSSKKDSSNLDKTNYKLARPRDIVYNKMRAWQGAVGVSNYQGIVSPAYVVERLRIVANARYFHHLMRTRAFAKEAERWSYGITSDMWSLRPEHFKLIYMCVPPIGEQNAIVGFLDWAGRRIRAYIRSKERLIELLDDYRQASIQQAVTGQINAQSGRPYPAYKRSSIGWLRQVPRDWGQRSLSTAASSIQTGPFGSQLHADEYVRGGIPVINPSHMRRGTLVPDPAISISKKKADELSRHLLSPGDVVMARRGEVGRCALVTEKEANWICGTGSLRIRPILGTFEHRYLTLVLSSLGVRDALALTSIGATMNNLNAGMVSRLQIPLPPMSDQVAIVDFASESNARIDAAIDLSRREIKLLQEYGRTLVASAVTGAIDVRKVADSLTEASPIRSSEDPNQAAKGRGDLDMDAFDASAEMVRS